MVSEKRRATSCVRLQVGKAHPITLSLSLSCAVGGEMLDYAMTRLKAHARIVLCGAISDYSESDLTATRDG